MKFRAPQAYYEGDNVHNLKAEVARGSKLKCSKCGLKGAALGCYLKSCQKSYHVPCALEIEECRWDMVNALHLRIYRIIIVFILSVLQI